MIVVLCALITVKYDKNFDAEKAEVHTFAASLAIFVYFLLPLVAFLAVLIYFKKADSPEMLQRIGAFYKNLNYARSRLVFIQPASFLLRRLHLALLVIQGTRILWY